MPDPEKSGLYLHLNTSKRSVTLDVSVPSGQVVLKKLLANADVFVAGEKHIDAEGVGAVVRRPEGATSRS